MKSRRHAAAKRSEPDVLRVRETPGVTPEAPVFPGRAPGSSREADTAGAGPPPLAATASRRLERRADLELGAKQQVPQGTKY
jgi:hypothetical protein